VIELVAIMGATVIVAGAGGYALARWRSGEESAQDAGLLRSETARLRRRAVSAEQELGRLRTQADRQRARMRRE